MHILIALIIWPSHFEPACQTAGWCDCADPPGSAVTEQDTDILVCRRGKKHGRWLRSTVNPSHVRRLSRHHGKNVLNSFSFFLLILLFWPSPPFTHFFSRKLKNRVAAQTARDRKKAKMGELEQQVLELELEVISLFFFFSDRGVARNATPTFLMYPLSMSSHVQLGYLRSWEITGNIPSVIRLIGYNSIKCTPLMVLHMKI